MLDARGTGVPLCVHWGADLGDLDQANLEQVCDARSPAVPPNAVGHAIAPSLFPVLSEGWTGRQAVAGSTDAAPSSPTFLLAGLDRGDEPHGTSIKIRLRDDASGLSLTSTLSFDSAGALEMSAELANTGETPWILSTLSATLPIPARARELLDFSGRWSMERTPRRRTLEHGTWSREMRHGRTGHDSPFVLAAGTAGFGFRSGEVWAVHLGWSGDQEVFADSTSMGHALLGAGELLQPGEVRLEPGDSYVAPSLFAAWSDAGLDGISRRFHAFLRARRPLPTRPVVLNTWEAVYFDHDVDRLCALADVAASVGVERFVLDDGWMTNRTDDRRALGDWTVDPVRWPDGLHPLVERVQDHGMDFGLWVEPEMVSLDSDLAREHPEWVLRSAQSTLPQLWRQQYAVDLGNPDAFANILGQLCALLDEYPIAYLKWDQNRDLLVGSAHRQTHATYRLMDELRSRYPPLEIESCSSGGGRVDFGVLAHADRVWASDTNDPFERQSIQRWTSLLVPPEFIGSHIGAGESHSTGRSTDLSFRLVTALFWSAGIEWDLALASEAELSAVATWIETYKELRGLLHSGTVVRADAVDPSVEVHGVVSRGGTDAVFAVVCLGLPRDATYAVTFPGLSPETVYRVEPIQFGEGPRVIQEVAPAWIVDGGLRLTGQSLAAVGLAMPVLMPAQALVLRFTAV